MTDRVIRPINIGSMRRTSQGDMSQRVPVDNYPNWVNRPHDEPHGRQPASADKLRRGFTADIATNWCTPLAVQQANIEALEDGVYPHP